MKFDTNFFKVEAIGLSTLVPILYNLTIDTLYQSLDASKSRWSFDAQSKWFRDVSGVKFFLDMIYLEFKKIPEFFFWENMWKDIFYEPPYQYFWFDMQERFKDAVGSTIHLLD